MAANSSSVSMKARHPSSLHFFVSEWFTHTPPHILADNFGVPAETFQDIPLRDLYIFQGKLPGDLAAEPHRP